MTTTDTTTGTKKRPAPATARSGRSRDGTPQEGRARQTDVGDEGANEVRLVSRPTSQRVDSVPCSAWSAALRRRIAGWRPGDTVEITGAVCCRFYQAGGATRSRVEVVASSARIIRRSPVA